MGCKESRLEREVFGLKFKNPVGLAAGFDKNAELMGEMANLGFGFVEIGTVTPYPNPATISRACFACRQMSALINRMGFNNFGVDVAAERIAASAKMPKGAKSLIIGGNIGKNKVTLTKML
jgi:dihydroorotate dehydrogenase